MGSVTQDRESGILHLCSRPLTCDSRSMPASRLVTIDRPEARNAIGFATIDALGAAVDEVADSGAAVLVLRGSGDRAFVSGGDIKELGSIRTHDAAVAMASRVRRLLDRVAAFPVPVIAALNGHALGGGAEVAVAADIASRPTTSRSASTRWRSGSCRRGAARNGSPSWWVAGRALLAIATGDVYDTPTTQRFGLVDIVVPRVTFDDEWRALARRLAASAPGTTPRREGRRRRGGPVLPPRARDRCHRRPRSRGCGRETRTGPRSKRRARSGERDDARCEVRSRV